MNPDLNGTRLIITGDYHIYGKYNKVKGEFDEFIKANKNHNLFGEKLKRIFLDADFRMFNLEDPISIKRKGIVKNGPHGVGSRESLIPMRKAKFELATFATNHTYDMGNEGIQETINACKEHDIDIIGCGLTKDDARKIYYKTINEIKIAILNFSRIEFNSVTEDHGGANPLDIIDNTKNIIEAKKNADFVFVVVHEGLDVYPLPYPALVRQMQFYVDMGADAIVLHHSRVVSGYEIYNGAPIFYSLGNLVHMTNNPLEQEGLIVEFILNKGEKIGFELHTIKLNKDSMLVSISDNLHKKKLLKKINMYSCIIKDDKLLDQEWNKFVKLKSTQYFSILSGKPRIFYRITKKLKLLNLYNKLLIKNKKKYLPIINLLRCQAHYEATKAALEFLYRDNL